MEGAAAAAAAAAEEEVVVAEVFCILLLNTTEYFSQLQEVGDERQGHRRRGAVVDTFVVPRRTRQATKAIELAWVSECFSICRRHRLDVSLLCGVKCRPVDAPLVATLSRRPRRPAAAARTHVGHRRVRMEEKLLRTTLVVGRTDQRHRATPVLFPSPSEPPASLEARRKQVVAAQHQLLDPYGTLRSLERHRLFLVHIPGPPHCERMRSHAGARARSSSACWHSAT
jgi:hypothetical protein